MLILRKASTVSFNIFFEVWLSRCDLKPHIQHPIPHTVIGAGHGHAFQISSEKKLKDGTYGEDVKT
jgi:hypothetical protein